MGEPPDPGESTDEEVVIGAEYAAAARAEQEHRAIHGEAESLLAGAGYDFWQGEHDLARFVPSTTDDLVARAVTTFRRADAAGRSTIRDGLTLDDFYTLLAFSRRSAVRTLRAADPAPATDGAAAVAMVDPERVDWRDIPVALSLVYHALDRSSSDAARVLRDAARLAVEDVAAFFEGFAGADPPHGDLAAWGFMEVATSDGLAFFYRHLAPFAPSYDLASIALDVAAVFDADAYRVHSLTAGAHVAPVWFPGTAQGRLERLLDRAPGTISIAARLQPAADPNAAHQQLTAFLLETGGRQDANRLTRWAVPGDRSDHSAVAVAEGPLACVTIARSFVAGVGPHETQESLERFAVPIAAALEAGMRLRPTPGPQRDR